MILAIDMGNTNTVIGGIDETKTYFIERVTTDQGRTDTEYAVSFKNILEMHQIDIASIEGAILSSVVPPVNSTILNAVEKGDRYPSPAGGVRHENRHEYHYGQPQDGRKRPDCGRGGSQPRTSPSPGGHRYGHGHHSVYRGQKRKLYRRCHPSRPQGFP